MENAIYNETVKQYEVVFTSSSSDVIQTDGVSNVNVYVKVNEDLDWVKAGYIKAKDQVTAIAVTEGLKVKLTASKPFEYEFKAQ